MGKESAKVPPVLKEPLPGDGNASGDTTGTCASVVVVVVLVALVVV